MLYTAELAKEYLEQSKDLGRRNREIENTAGLIVAQMSDSLIEGNGSFKKSLDKPLMDECADYLERSGIDVEFVGTSETKGLVNKVSYQYKFTF